MKDIVLRRVSSNTKGTFGVLMDNEAPFAVTLERPWLGNQSNVSCIPPGVYVCRRVDSPKFGDTFEVTGVPGRSHILFHKGNRVDDSHGCILVAEEFGKLGDEIAILSSGRGYGELMSKLEGSSEFILTIQT